MFVCTKLRRITFQNKMGFKNDIPKFYVDLLLDSLRNGSECGFYVNEMSALIVSVVIGTTVEQRAGDPCYCPRALLHAY